MGLGWKSFGPASTKTAVRYEQREVRLHRHLPIDFLWWFHCWARQHRCIHIITHTYICCSYLRHTCCMYMVAQSLLECRTVEQTTTSLSQSNDCSVRQGPDAIHGALLFYANFHETEINNCHFIIELLSTYSDGEPCPDVTASSCRFALCVGGSGRDLAALAGKKAIGLCGFC